MIPTGWQIRRAREMVGLTQDAFAKAAGVGFATVVHAEMIERPQMPTRATAAIRMALEARGIEFLREDGGIGVQLRDAVTPAADAAMLRRFARRAPSIQHSRGGAALDP